MNGHPPFPYFIAGRREDIPMQNFRALIVMFCFFGLSACVHKSHGPKPDFAGQTLVVMSSGGFTAAYQVLAPKFEQETGAKLISVYGASSGGATDSIPERLKRGELADVVILERNSLDNLAATGFVNPNSTQDLVRSQIGMAVREGALVPDISTKDSFIATLFQASSIGYSASASGQHLASEVFPKIGLVGPHEMQLKRIVSERVGAVVARGEVEVGFQQVSEILPIKGVRYVGLIPSEFQRTTVFSAGIANSSQKAELAQVFIQFVSSKDVAEVIDGTGLDALSKYNGMPQGKF
jgi:molybdate transport system substrate-binding protein